MDNDWLGVVSPLKFFLNGTCGGANFYNGCLRLQSRLRCLRPSLYR
jgi:hypothetical protein